MAANAYRQPGATPAAPAPKSAAPLPAWDTERTGPRLSDSAPPLPKPPSPRPTLGRSGAFPPLRQDAPSSVLGPKAERAETPPAAPPKPPAKPALPKEPVSPEPRPFVPAIPQAELPGQEALEPPGETPWRIAGELLRTYIVCESEAGEVWLVDKHAAHERVNFDRLKAALKPPMRQALLTPAAVELGKEDGALLLEHLPLLEELGFSCEDFGGGAVLVRELPADLDAEDVTATLEEIAGKLRSGRSLAERREGLLHTMACKAAIKGGWKSDPEELRVLVSKVQSGEVRYCPHGRPVAVKITKHELEKLFKRA